MRNDKGRRAEWELRKILEDRGYYVVRSAASKLVDLIIVGTGGDVTAVEVKSTSGSALSLTHVYEKEQYAGHLALSDRGVPVIYAVRWGACRWDYFPVPLKSMLLKEGGGNPSLLPAL